MKNQEVLLKHIRTKISSKQSVLDEIAIILGISYDAAHRRVSGKSKFTIDETIELCNYFSISMDSIFLKKNNYILEKSKSIKSVQDFKEYLSNSTSILKHYKTNESSVYYSAKDIPLHYTVGGSMLSKFKLFVWLSILTPNQNQKFEYFKIETELLEESIELISIFNSTSRIEIWNDTTINSSLQQVMYFYEAGLISFENTILVLEDIKCIVEKVEKLVQSNNHKFELFYNELLLLNNTVLFTSSENAHYFIPHNMLSYYVTSDKKICEEELEFIKNQLNNSMSISKSGKKDQKKFFNRMYQKIEFYKTKIIQYME